MFKIITKNKQFFIRDISGILLEPKSISLYNKSNIMIKFENNEFWIIKPHHD